MCPLVGPIRPEHYVLLRDYRTNPKLALTDRRRPHYMLSQKLGLETSSETH
jgi:hypothetical protein